jgi:Cu2+-exporting ATPase
MTGFTCTKVVHVGEELELIVDGNAQDYVDHWPLTVTDLTIINKSRIRISYCPKVIGARDLLSDAFFEHTKLAPPSPPPLIASGRAYLWKSFYMTIFSTLCTMPVLVLAWARLPRHDILYGAISMTLATIVQVVVAGPFYASAIKTLIFSRMIEMDLLIVLSTTTAYVYSIVAYAYLAVGKPLVTAEFFETSTLLVTLIMVGRTVSAFARQRAVESITIESLQANTAILVDPESLEEREIDVRLLQYYDVFKVLPDMSVVTDGVIVLGESDVDESMITGETTLIRKRPGNTVVAGSVNHSGTLKIQVTHLPYENTIKTIKVMVDEAKSSKPKVQELADRVAGYFVPAILGITLVVFVVWFAVGKAVRQQSTTTSCIAAMTYAISVLIVSCPCAIGLAVPMVVVIAGGVGARHGLIFKTAETIDNGRKVSHVIFDKTGTLTQGKLYVVAEEFVNGPSSFELSLILGLTTNSTHPVAIAVASHLRSSGIQPSIVDHIVSIPGKGIEAKWKAYAVRAGNPYWLNVQDSHLVRKILSTRSTIFCVTVDGKLIAVYGLQDSLRPDAIPTINELRKRSIEVSLISGDNDSTVQSVASQLGIPPSNVRARCTPAQKREYVKSQLEPPKSIVLFCGDGTNDAPSLAQASIGVHMNEGTEVAAGAADAVIMRPSLQGILTLMDLSRAFHRRVVFNFAWSFGYNLFAVLLAAGGFPRTRIPPQYAGLGEIVSVVPVIAIAMGLKWKKF